MLSAEKAKLRGAFDNTKSQMHKASTLNKKPIQMRLIRINLKIKIIIFLTVTGLDKTKEFMADFRKSWFIVSQILVSTIKNRIKNRPSFILYSLAFPCYSRKP
jgi:hypothetical protein